jgi:hypothetical protein
MPPKGSRRKVAVAATAAPTDVVADSTPPSAPDAATAAAEGSDPSHPPQADDAEPKEHIVVQLSIKKERLNELLQGSSISTILEYDPVIHPDPSPYDPCNNSFTSQHVSVYDLHHSDTNIQTPCPHNAFETMCDHPSSDLNGIEPATIDNEINNRQPLCFWCCHEIELRKFGMPISYDTIHQTFHVFGTFCSLECAAAYNFSTHMGSDRLWDIHSWIQLLARQNNLPTPIRPAPSRYVLKKFGGAIDIQEFRQAHKSFAKTYVFNIPPLINIVPQIECVNSSFISLKTVHSLDMGEKSKLIRRKSIVDKKNTLESKMNLTFQHDM